MATNMDDDIEIPVWIGDQQKWVTGLNSKTTCHDIIYALLSHTSKSSSDVDNYAMFECWKGIERQLAGRTKISKIWKAWGKDSENVTLTLRTVDLDTSCEVSHAKPRVFHKSRKHASRNALGERHYSYPLLTQRQKDLKDVHSENPKGRNRLMTKYNSDVVQTQGKTYSEKVTSRASLKCGLPEIGCIRPAVSMCQENEQFNGYKDKRIQHTSRKSLFNPIHTSQSGINQVHSRDHRSSRSRSHKRDSHAVEHTSTKHQPLPREHRPSHRRTKQDKQQILKQKSFQKLLHLILGQERKIREQLDKLKSVDIQLKNQECKSSEMQVDMECSLPEETQVVKTALFPALKSNDLEAYSYMCETILGMDYKLQEEQTRIADLSTIIKEETFVCDASYVKPQLKVTTLTESNLADAKGNFLSDDEKIQIELEALRNELKHAADIGVSQQKEIDSIAKSMEEYDRQMEDKAKKIDDLLVEFDAVSGKTNTEEKIHRSESNATDSNFVERSKGFKSSPVLDIKNDCLLQTCVSKVVDNVFNSTEINSDETPTQSSEQCVKEEVKNVNSKGKSFNVEDLYNLTIVSDFNSTWDEDSFIISTDNIASVPRERVDSLHSPCSENADDIKKSPSGSSSASSGFCDLSPVGSDRDPISPIPNTNDKHSNNDIYTSSRLFPFPSYDAMKNLDFRCRYISQESLESGMSSFRGDDHFLREVETIV